MQRRIMEAKRCRRGNHHPSTIVHIGLARPQPCFHVPDCRRLNPGTTAKRRCVNPAQIRMAELGIKVAAIPPNARQSSGGNR